jgi:hypothetical protein
MYSAADNGDDKIEGKPSACNLLYKSNKKSHLYSKAFSVPSSDDGGGNGDGTDTQEDLPFPPVNNDDKSDKKLAASNCPPKSNKKKLPERSKVCIRDNYSSIAHCLFKPQKSKRNRRKTTPSTTAPSP